jgi:DNA-binding GntR family transcriptional regulator
MIDLYDARTAIESEAAALCAIKAPPETINRMEGLAAEFKRAIPKRDGRALKETDMPFHKLIVDSCGNKYLIRSYNELLPNLTMYQGSWIKFINPDKENPWSSQVVHQHGAIVSSIKLRIPDLARQAMSEHIKSSLNFVAYSDNTDDPFWIVKKCSEK